MEGDFNGDGKPDLAVTNASGVSVLLGNGDGTFQPPITTPLDHGYVIGGNGEMVAGDFNGDGRLDLAVADFGGGRDELRRSDRTPG